MVTLYVLDARDQEERLTLGCFHNHNLQFFFLFLTMIMLSYILTICADGGWISSFGFSFEYIGLVLDYLIGFNY